MGRQRGDAGGQRDADGGKRNGRAESEPEHPAPGMQSAIEQNQGQCGAADQIGGAIIAGMKAQTIRPRRHAETEKSEQQRCTDPGRDHTGDDAGQQKQGSDEDEFMRLLHVSPAPAISFLTDKTRRTRLLRGAPEQIFAGCGGSVTARRLLSCQAAASRHCSTRRAGVRSAYFGSTRQPASSNCLIVSSSSFDRNGLERTRSAPNSVATPRKSSC